MTAVLSEISDFDQLFKTFISALLVDCNTQNGILECSLMFDLKDFWKFEVESKFCEKMKIFMTAVLSEISDFDQLFKTFFQTCEWIASLKMAFSSVLMSISSISESLRLSQNFVKKLKILMTAVISEISDFDQLFKTSFQPC